MIAVITGASRGIGKGIATKFLAEGFDIIINSRKIADLEEVKAAFEAAHPERKIWIKATDMSQQVETKAFADFVLEQGEEIAVVVNNAGVFLPGDIKSEPEGNLELMMQTNLFSAYHLTRALLPNMIAAKKGHIFNICSVASLKAYPGGGSYTISKHALYGLSRTLREELKEDGIRVTGLFPGAVYTASWEGAGFPPERMMSVEDVAETVWACYQLSQRTVIEDVVMRPMLGDI